MQRCIQHRAAGAAEGLDLIAALHSSRLQKRRCFGGQPIIQCPHLAAQAGDCLLRRRVDALQRRHHRVADAVAGVKVGGVGLILHIVLPKGGTVCLGIGAGQAQAGAAVDAAAGRDTCQPVQACPPRHAEQERLRLVRAGVGRGNQSFLPRGQLVEPGIAQLPRPFLTGLGRDGHTLFLGIIQEQFYPVPAAERRDKVGVSPGRRTADTVVDVGGQHFDSQVFAPPKQKKQQSHRVCSTGVGCNDSVARLEQTLLAAVGQQSLLDTLYSFFRVSTHGSHPGC